MATISTIAHRCGVEHSEVERYFRRRRVLLVDDDASIRLICSLNLRTAEFEVIEAADGPQGFEQATLHTPGAYALGVAGFVAKPFDPAALVALLSSVLERTAAA